jgi:hypothetical protein
MHQAKKRLTYASTRRAMRGAPRSAIESRSSMTSRLLISSILGLIAPQPFLYHMVEEHRWRLRTVTARRVFTLAYGFADLAPSIARVCQADRRPAPERLTLQPVAGAIASWRTPAIASRMVNRLSVTSASGGGPCHRGASWTSI